MIKGELLIGNAARRGTNGELRGVEAAIGKRLEPGFGGACLQDLDEACRVADAAFDSYRATSLQSRVAFHFERLLPTCRSAAICGLHCAATEPCGGA